MKLLKKHLKPIILFAALTALLVGAFLFYTVLKLFLPIDLSQNYRAVQDVEKIVFETNWEHQCYKRCFWGLKKIENTNTRGEADTSLSELSESSELPELPELPNLIDTDNKIHQSVYSPNKQYILYCEIDYNYTGSDMTDDEYCYYRVYDVETGEIVTIYQGYKEWYNLLWLD